MDDSAEIIASQEQEQPATDPGAESQEQQVPNDAAADAVTDITLVAEQYQGISDGFRAIATMQFLCCVLVALLLGSVLYGHFVRGWRQ